MKIKITWKHRAKVAVRNTLQAAAHDVVVSLYRKRVGEWIFCGGHTCPLHIRAEIHFLEIQMRLWGRQ